METDNKSTDASGGRVTYEGADVCACGDSFSDHDGPGGTCNIFGCSCSAFNRERPIGYVYSDPTGRWLATDSHGLVLASFETEENAEACVRKAHGIPKLPQGPQIPVFGDSDGV